MNALHKLYIEQTKGYLTNNGCYFPFTRTVSTITYFPMYYFIVYADFMYDISSLESVLMKALKSKEPYLFLETLQNEVYKIEHRDDIVDTYNDVTKTRLFGDCEDKAGLFTKLYKSMLKNNNYNFITNNYIFAAAAICYKTDSKYFNNIINLCYILML